MSKGIDYGEISLLCQTGKIVVPDWCGKFTNDWETVLLLYANYKEDNGGDVAQLLTDWGIPERHWNWFNQTRQKLRRELL